MKKHNRKMAENSPSKEAEAGGGKPEAQPKKETKAVSTPPTYAKDEVEKWIGEKTEVANAEHERLHKAKAGASKKVEGALRYFDKAEAATDAYENILNKAVTSLSQKMALTAIETEGYIAKAAEITAGIAAAKTIFAAAKAQLVAADEAGAKLSDLVRREWKDDTNVQLLENHIPHFSDIVEHYECEIEAASDQMNNALLLLNEISVTLNPENLKTKTQAAKKLTDDYYAALFANLLDSKGKLEAGHAALRAVQTEEAQAEFAHNGSMNNIHVLERLKSIVAI